MAMKYTAQSLAHAFCRGQYVSTVDAVLWQQTFAYLAKRGEPTMFQRSAVQQLWIAYGGDIRAKVRNDALVLAVLKMALPGYQGAGITLYRGESWFLFDQQQIGFCWTPSETLATTYAKGLNAVESGGVLLKCYAPPTAILAHASDNTTWICDPNLLLRMTTLALFPKL